MSISSEEEDQQEVWRRYFEATNNKPVHPIMDALEAFLPPSGLALDLGCGAGRGTIWLLDHNMEVVAVDAEQAALDHLKQKLPADARVKLINSNFDTLRLEPDSYDVVVAVFSLFFLPPEAHAKFWNEITLSLKRGGLVASQFLGINDTWADRGFTTHDRDGVEKALAPYKTISLNEEEKDGETALGDTKHWHVFHVLARKL